MESDIIVIGAGAAGLMAARELAATGKKISVMEARNRIGGRAYTLQESRFGQQVETGAEFVHGNLELTLQLLAEAGLKTRPAAGEVWRNKNGTLSKQEDFIANADAMEKALHAQKDECSVATFLNTYFKGPQHEDLKKSIQQYVEGYYAGNIYKASFLAFKEEWQKEEEPQYRVEGGYSGLMAYLHKSCSEQGVQFYTEASVKNITWAFEKVTLTTASGLQLGAKKMISTVPLSVLFGHNSLAAIQFQPRLTAQEAAAKQLGYGSVVKIVMQFTVAFWEEGFSMQEAGFIFSDETIPTWWTQFPLNSTQLVGWCAGPQADQLKDDTSDQLFQKALTSLAKIFDLPEIEIEKKISAWNVFNWATDPLTQGGYSYLTTKSKEALKYLNQPVAQTIFFAGEGLYDNINMGTVEAALQSGRQTAQKVAQSF